MEGFAEFKYTLLQSFHSYFFKSNMENHKKLISPEKKSTFPQNFLSFAWLHTIIFISKKNPN